VAIAFTFDDATLAAVDALMAQIPLLHRTAEVKRAMRSGVKIVADRYAELLPRSVRQKVAGIHVADMPGDAVKDYELSIVGVAGLLRTKKRTRTNDRKFPPNIEALLEDGHRIVVRGTAEQKKGGTKGYSSPSRWKHGENDYGAQAIRASRRGTGDVVGQVPPGRYLERAAEQSRAAVETELTEALTRAIERLQP
jgi:hypothetical protein